MKYIKNGFLSLFIVLCITQVSFSQKKSYEAKIDSIIALMTLEEKAGQLNQLSSGLGFGPIIRQETMDSQKKLAREGKIGSFLNAIGSKVTRELQKTAVEESRLKIPLIFGLDVIHGFRTTFPIPLAEAATWDPALVEMSARVQAKEASSAGIHWTFSPMVDIARDPRWGRIIEGSGEDTYLGSLMAAARVKGYQGNLDNEHIIACTKHYAAYGVAEGGRDYNTVDISDRTLREVYLPPFKATVDAGVRTFMCSFNEISGVPSSANRYLLTDILRGEWKFDGFMVSDWNSVGELIPHGVAANPAEATILGLNAGVDMDMESRCYIDNLVKLIKEKKISETVVDESIRRILRVKFEIGLFDDPYKYCSEEREKKNILTDENKKSAYEVAGEAVVLLKNDKSLLPLSKDLKTVAVIGPLADSKKDPLGAWAALGNPENVVSVMEGLKNKLGKINFVYVKGCDVNGTSKDGFADAVKAAKTADAVILILGEENNMSGEASNRSTLELPGVQNELAMEIAKTGKPIVTVLLNGRPLSTSWISENMPSIINAWHLGLQSGNVIADVLFGDINPSGKLPVTVPRTVGQVPIYYNHKNTGRPGNKQNHFTSQYLDLPLTPLYPFGHGLSYSKFEYSNLKLSSNNITMDEKVRVTVDVKNSGNYDGKEVVQLYIRDLVGSVTRPVKELKGFQKILLKKGETKTVEFTIDNSSLAFYDKDMKWTAEPGEFTVFVGTSSADALEANFSLK